MALKRRFWHRFQDYMRPGFICVSEQISVHNHLSAKMFAFHKAMEGEVKHTDWSSAETGRLLFLLIKSQINYLPRNTLLYSGNTETSVCYKKYLLNIETN